MEQYSEFAFVYDELMDEVDYDGWVDYLEQLIANEGVKVQNILELACGTGNITIPLAKKGYDIAGIDISDEMLGVAREKSEEDGIELVLLEQDITELDFDVENLDCVLCACDGFNYITEDRDLEKIFIKAYALLKDGGMFIFDISSHYKLSEVLGDNTYGENREDVTYMWQNFYCEEDETVEMELVFFVKEEDGSYTKFEEFHRQRAYKEGEVADMLANAGFEAVKLFGDFGFEAPSEDAERIFFVCKK
ncbi:MAG: class I SAM-dependent methyltransferase [Clostridioides sp.]|jgi:ubiquinone/menaquinone biosynthesis C-methylase UbiE|nr:class I SAM-dependent methyltransferase [Clostridioides sp.]